MKRVLVCGAGGFIGGHLIDRLRDEGYWIRGVDIKRDKQRPGQVAPDEFKFLDLRIEHNCGVALAIPGRFDEVYQLAADLGGMGYIPYEECKMLHDNLLINAHMTHAAAESGVRRYFFSSSACVYQDMQPDDPMLDEDAAYPALPDNEYGWEKLYSERLAMAYGRRYPMKVRIARFFDVTGEGMPLDFKRAKVIAALCRKVAEAEDGGELEIWGDGTAMRAQTYVTDTVDGVYRLMHSEIDTPVNIGRPQFASINELADTIIDVSGKRITKKHVPGVVGVHARNFSMGKIQSLGWEPRLGLREIVERVYAWVDKEIQGDSIN